MTRRPTRRMPLISVRHRQIKIATFGAVLMSSANIQNPDVNRGYGPAPSPGLRPPSPPSGEREGVRGRFMGSLHDFSVAHWDHEPLRLTEARSGPRVCDPQPARFMERASST